MTKKEVKVQAKPKTKTEVIKERAAKTHEDICKYVRKLIRKYKDKKRQRKEQHLKRMKEDCYYRWKCEREQEERRDLIGFTVTTIVFLPLMLLFLRCAYNTFKSPDEKFHEDFQKGAAEYVKYNPIAVSPVALSQSSSVGSPEDIPVWTNKGGDY